MPLDVLVEQLDVPVLLDRLQAERLQVPQAGLDLRLGIAAPGRVHRPARSRAHVLDALERQLEDAGPLEPFEQAERGPDPVGPARCMPAQLLADRLRQFLAAQGREHGDRLLDVGELLAREAPAEERGGLSFSISGSIPAPGRLQATIANPRSEVKGFSE